jgi:crossover junction endodeoxyribonuclease RuvC
MAAASGPIVMGIDPGSLHTGYAVLALGQAKGGKFTLLAAGAISAPARQPLPQRLAIIFRKLTEIIAQYRPGEMAVEGVFTHKNARTALLLGQARGIALLAGSLAGLEIFEYPPATVKKALVGYGRATKEQVRAMVGGVLGRPVDLPLDAADALALAITHLHTRKTAHLLERLK